MLTDFTFILKPMLALINVKILLKWQFIVAIYYSKNHLIGSSYVLAVCNARNKRTRTKWFHKSELSFIAVLIKELM